MTGFELSEEYQDLSDTVRDFADNVVAPVSAKHDEEHSFPHEVVKQMAEMGLFGLPFPEEFGGMGGDYFALALALEQLGRVDQSVAITLEAGAIRPGPVTFVVRNGGTMIHGFEIEAEEADGDHDHSGSGHGGLKFEGPAMSPGEVVRLPADLPPGTYTIECFVDGHDDLGMETTLVVRRDAPLVRAADPAGMKARLPMCAPTARNAASKRPSAISTRMSSTLRFRTSSTPRSRMRCTSARFSASSAS